MHQRKFYGSWKQKQHTFVPEYKCHNTTKVWSIKCQIVAAVLLNIFCADVTLPSSRSRENDRIVQGDLIRACAVQLFIGQSLDQARDILNCVYLHRNQCRCDGKGNLFFCSGGPFHKLYVNRNEAVRLSTTLAWSSEVSHPYGNCTEISQNQTKRVLSGNNYRIIKLLDKQQILCLIQFV